MDNDKFEFNYSAPTKSEREQIEDIRKNYLPKDMEENKLTKLKKLDAYVKNVPTIWGLCIGILGTLIFGLGLTMILEWNILIYGIIVCCVGTIPMLISYPIYLKIKKHLTMRHKDEILNLSNELLNENND